ncbi:hypothetical protein ACN38_g8110 [Penicillium nordicum]|uniref:Uncharacterized protein n=1 Tax=Penicillium nordicum TaxID=229535 RepID=A0A0M8P0I5_9EURO|nr:hypothetical protein ACN38_g8110 [Penicillium nordicum]
MSAIEGIFKVWKSDKLKNGFTPLKDFVNHKTRGIEEEKTQRPESYRSSSKKKKKRRERERRRWRGGGRAMTK